VIYPPRLRDNFARYIASTRLLDQVRERIRYLHYSQATEKAYIFWLRWFIRWSGLHHPRDMGKPEVEAFLSMLANDRRVSASTHKQALSAILFLYREVLGPGAGVADGDWQTGRAQEDPDGSEQGGTRQRLCADGWPREAAGPAALWHRHAPDGNAASQANADMLTAPMPEQETIR
jgi:hypothetical protein